MSIRFAFLTLVVAMGCGSSSGSAPPGVDGAGGGGGGGGGGGDGCEPVDGDDTTTLVFINSCASQLEVRGSDGVSHSIAPGARACQAIGTAEEALSAKRYWGFLGEDPGAEHHTLAELTFNTDFNDFDWYNISHVDAHNLTMRISPLARPDCDTLVCDSPALLSECPDVGRQMGSGGDLISCVSPDRDNPDSPVAQHFESCDDAYAWSGDDQRGTDPSPVRACAGEDWEIEFCP